LLIVLSIISMVVGVIQLSINEIFSLSEQQNNILASSRFPRTISIIIDRASVAVSGLIVQLLTRNNCVSSTRTGTMDCAQHGILICIISFPPIHLLGRLVFALILSMFGTLLFMQSITRIKLKDVIFVPLIGLMLGGVVSSIATFIALRTNTLQI